MALSHPTLRQQRMRKPIAKPRVRLARPAPPAREVAPPLAGSKPHESPRRRSRSNSEAAHTSPEAADVSEDTSSPSTSPPPASRPGHAFKRSLNSGETETMLDRRSQSSSPAQHPRLVIRIPSLAARRALADPQSTSPHNTSESAPPAPQKRPRSPTPDSEEDDFAASFMRKRTVAAALR
ncbi:hypothetical protein AURDEDRAFT_163432 [Auricularia subglabra TFB-10046 SS5]|nr:hypothetical protein AURDEDRAFT_163432 [Auricularia subglabra TFB-10046 SS5]